MVTVYELRQDDERIKSVQKATLNTRQFGIRKTHGLFGSPEWWGKIASGKLKVCHLRGKIVSVHRGSNPLKMGDWPVFSMRTDSGEESQWTLDSLSPELANLYVVGRRIEVDYIVQWGKRRLLTNTKMKIALAIRVEESSGWNNNGSVVAQTEL